MHIRESDLENKREKKKRKKKKKKKTEKERKKIIKFRLEAPSNLVIINKKKRTKSELAFQQTLE